MEKHGKGASRTAVMTRKSREELIDLLGGRRRKECDLTDIGVLTIDHAAAGQKIEDQGKDAP